MHVLPADTDAQPPLQDPGCGPRARRPRLCHCRCRGDHRLLCLHLLDQHKLQEAAHLQRLHGGAWLSPHQPCVPAPCRRLHLHAGRAFPHRRSLCEDHLPPLHRRLHPHSDPHEGLAWHRGGKQRGDGGGLSCLGADHAPWRGVRHQRRPRAHRDIGLHRRDLVGGDLGLGVLLLCRTAREPAEDADGRRRAAGVAAGGRAPARRPLRVSPYPEAHARADVLGSTARGARQWER
mmetsp:Transcript_11492/g.27284  ORF Transcript_11492/g.27284 Transcript_11492/m.27284 type:complete len:234 (-) Transcript_11492:1009-1710(-)